MHMTGRVHLTVRVNMRVRVRVNMRVRVRVRVNRRVGVLFLIYNFAIPAVYGSAPVLVKMPKDFNVCNVNTGPVSLSPLPEKAMPCSRRP